MPTFQFWKRHPRDSAHTYQEISYKDAAGLMLADTIYTVTDLNKALDRLEIGSATGWFIYSPPAGETFLKVERFD